MPENPLLTQLGKRIAARRRARGWSQERLAERADLSANAVGRIELGLADLRVSTLEALAAALETSVAELCGLPAGTRLLPVQRLAFLTAIPPTEGDADDDEPPR